MMFNLYPMKKMTTINNARAIFLMRLQENTYIDISAHAFSVIANETRKTTRAKLILPSLLIRIFRTKGVEISQDISLMPTPLAINALTIARIKVRLLGEEKEGDQKQRELMDTETEAEGQPLTSRSHGKRSKASSSLEVPSDAFHIILERIDGLQDIQIKHFDRLTAILEQINLLSAKFESFIDQP